MPEPKDINLSPRSISELPTLSDWMAWWEHNSVSDLAKAVMGQWVNLEDRGWVRVHSVSPLGVIQVEIGLWEYAEYSSKNGNLTTSHLSLNSSNKAPKKMTPIQRQDILLAWEWHRNRCVENRVSAILKVGTQEEVDRLLQAIAPCNPAKPEKK